MPAEVEKAIAQAEGTAVELVRLGRVEDALRCVFGAIREALRPLVESARRQGEMLGEFMKTVREQRENMDELVKSIREQRENIDRLTKNVDKLTEDVEALRRGLELEAHMRRSDVGAVRGEVVELRVIRGLTDWFKEHAPEYEVHGWPMRRGPDLVVEGKGVLAAVEATVRPKAEDVDQLIAGAGIVKLEWGRKPDLLVIYSYSGEVPEEVAEYATEKGVKIARGPRQLKKLLDEVAKAREGRALHEPCSNGL